MDMRRLHVFFLTCIFCMSYFFTAFAAPVASGSDAVQIRPYVASDSDASLDDMFPSISDFLEPAPMSSLASIQSTINFKDTYINVRYKNKNGTYVYYPIATGVNQFTYDLNKIDGDVSRLGIVLDKGALPAPGTYRLQIDYASQVGIDWYQFSFWAHKYSSNAATGSKEVIFTDYVKQSSGDYYADLTIDLNNVSRLEIQGYFNAGTLKGLIGGKFAIRFTPVSDSRPDENVAAPGPSAEQQFQDTVSNGVSSIGDTLKQIVQTISLQLEALWDQMFNLIHLPELEKMEQIRQAIENLDLNVEVNVDEINQQIQQSTDQVTNGYDNGGMTSDQKRLDSVINEYDKAEDELFNDAKDHISGFEFDNYFEKYTAPLEDISYFLSGIYTKLGSLNVPIAFSLSLTIALLFIGYYRFKGGG